MPYTFAVWLIDDHEIRRSALSSFLVDWSIRRSADLRGVSSLQEIAARDRSQREICILNCGGGSLADPEVRLRVESLLGRLNGRPLVLLTDLDSVSETLVALQLGASALIPTSLSKQIALAGLDFVLSGGTFFPSAALNDIIRSSEEVREYGYSKGADIQDVSSSEASPFANRFRPLDPAANRAQAPPGNVSEAGPPLTPRQQQILGLLQKGWSNKEIARDLTISDTTVKIFVRQLMKKFGAKNRTQVALRAG